MKFWKKAIPHTFETLLVKNKFIEIIHYQQQEDFSL